ncbi:MAG: zinc ribbon domain-containing protein [Firmicutes bacterium]|nr:zinc ribbon domain-containing protein [Bacillota bacterium]
MKIKCDYCGFIVDERSPNCPHCGGSLSGVNRMAGGTPQTIEQLRQWYVDHNLPPEDVTRFFIGKDTGSPKAFGIYQDSSGDFIVYKNKSNGKRAIRYQGSDEAYAVNELYQRLKAEIADQKSRNAANKSKKDKKNDSSTGCLSLLIVNIVIWIPAILFGIFDKTPSRGYYRYENTDYYYQASNWYEYDQNADNWYTTDNVPEVFAKESDDYRIYDHEGKRFEDSSWYREDDDSDDWDSDSSWDSNDSWDSGSTDWDSDW